LDEMADETMPELFEIHPKGNMPGLRDSDKKSSPAKILAGRQIRPTENGRIHWTLTRLENSLT